MYIYIYILYIMYTYMYYIYYIISDIQRGTLNLFVDRMCSIAALNMQRCLTSLSLSLPKSKV